ncbi:MAG TPA: hypothetical protein VIH86_14230, partial [Puia sp.]
PDFDEFDVPKSKSKKSSSGSTGAGAGKKAAKTDDLDFDEDLKDLDLFSEERFDDDEEDDF